MADCFALTNNLNIELTEEEKMARYFIQEANKYFKDYSGRVYAIPSLRKNRDMDLVIWMHFDNCLVKAKTGYINIDDDGGEKEFRLATMKQVWFNSALLIIELKKHNTSDSIRVNNGKLFVKYNEGWKNASDQSFDQTFALKTYLREWLNIKDDNIPKIQNLVWLYKCPPTLEGLQELDNVIFQELDMEKLIHQLFMLRKPISYDGGRNIQYHAANKAVIDIIDTSLDFLRKEKANGLGIVTKRKLNQIFKNSFDISNQAYFKEVGKKFTIIKGNPGTGKTIHLAHLAYQLKNLAGFQPLILTFNNALVQDIQRMLFYSGYQGELEIKTIHSFFIGLLHKVGVLNDLENGEYDFNKYEDHLGELKKLGTQQELREILGLTYDIALVDEAQDCLEVEKDLLFHLFSPENIVVSYGSRQIVRKKELDWSIGIARSQKNIKLLETSHRNKQDLVSYFNEFSLKLFSSNPWELKENKQLTGGKLAIFTSKEAYQKASHISLVHQLINDKCAKYDMMFLVPSRDRQQDYANSLEHELLKWDHPGFNATFPANKKLFFPINEHRILNFQSCRGLEAWYLVCWKLDIIIKELKEKYEHAPESNLSFEEGLNSFISNWLLMIFTRAIDTLIIIIDDPKSLEANQIIELTKGISFGHMAILYN